MNQGMGSEISCEDFDKGNSYKVTQTIDTTDKNEKCQEKEPDNSAVQTQGINMCNIDQAHVGHEKDYGKKAGYVDKTHVIQKKEESDNGTVQAVGSGISCEDSNKENLDKNEKCQEKEPDNSAVQTQGINMCNIDQAHVGHEKDYSNNYNYTENIERTVCQGNLIDAKQKVLPNQDCRISQTNDIIPQREENTCTNFKIEICALYILMDDKKDLCSGKIMDLLFYVYDMYGNCSKHYLYNITINDAMNPNIIHKVPGTANFFEKKSEFSSFLYAYMNKLLYTYEGKTVYLYNESGWKTFNGFRAYLTADGVIGHPEIAAKANVDLHIIDSYRGSMYREFKQMLFATKNTAHMSAILLYVFSQFLHSVFKETGFGIKHILFIVGPRGCKKTSVALCFTQMGNDKLAPRFNFQATESGIQANLMKYPDRCMLIDDLAPSLEKQKQKHCESLLESVVRLFGDSGERVINTNFMKNNADKIDYSVKGGLIGTGEYFYSTGSESSIARAVVVSLEPDSVNENILSYFQNNPNILETMVNRFLMYVTGNYAYVIDVIRKKVQYYRFKAQELNFSNARYSDYMGQYMAVANILAAFFMAESNISEDEAVRLVSELERDISAILLENDKNMRKRAPINILLGAIVFSYKMGKTGNWGMAFTDEIRIVMDDNALYFRQMDLPDIVREYANKTNMPYVSLSSTELGDLLIEYGYCESCYEGKIKRKGKRYTEYGKTRIMSIPFTKINEFNTRVQFDD